MNKHFKNNNIAMSFLETIIIVAVIGILITLAIPKYENVKEMAHLTHIKNDTKLIEKYVREHYLSNGVMPNSSTKINDNELNTIINEKSSYLNGVILNPTDVDKIHGNKYILNDLELKNNVDTILKGEFIFTADGTIYVDDKITEKPKEVVWDKYETKLDGHELTLLGFKKDYNGNKSEFKDVINLESNGFKIVAIADNAYINDELIGEFPKLNNLRVVGNSAFKESKFTGNFPKLDSLEEVGNSAFYNSQFTGQYPVFTEQMKIGSKVFYKSEFLNIPSVQSIETIIEEEKYKEAQSMINKLPKGKDEATLQDLLNLKYSLKHNPNIGSIDNAKGWGKVSTKKIDDKYIVSAKDCSGGFGLITDRDIGIDYKKGQEYIITFDVKSSNAKALRYNYIISDVGNARINNIYLKNNNEWQQVSLRFASDDKDRINAGVLIGGDVRFEPEGTEFEVKNVSIKAITTPQ